MKGDLNKLSLVYNSNKNYIFKSNKLKEDPNTKLISNFPEVLAYAKAQNIKSKFKNLYLNIKKISEILYDEEKIIFIKPEDCYPSLSEYYYLAKLINDRDILISFTYSLDFITNIHNHNKKCLKPLRKAIISKILLILIKNYKGFDSSDKNDEKIVEIEKENRDIIKNNLAFKEIGLNFSAFDLEKIDIEDLYVEIVYSIIKKDIMKKNYNYIKKNLIRWI